MCCLAFPGLVIDVKENFAKIDFGAGTIRDSINISQIPVKVGDFVLVHAGYAIQILDLEEANRTIMYWEENFTWKCERCSIVNECPAGEIIMERKLKMTKSGSNAG